MAAEPTPPPATVPTSVPSGTPATTGTTPATPDTTVPETDDGGGFLGDALGSVIPDIGLPGVGDIADGIAEGLLAGFFTMLSEALVSAATKVNELVLSGLNDSTTVDLGSLRGGGILAMTTSIGVAMVLAFFFASIVRGLLRGEYSAITRAALVDVPLALVGTIGLVTFAQILLGITDAATGALLEAAAGDLGESTAGVVSSPEAVVAGGLLGGLVMIVYIVAALLTWMWLFLRAALIYFIVVAAPLGLATRAFPPAAVFARRTIEMAVALIVSKFFLAVALALGSSQFNAAATGDAELSSLVVGAATMVLAAFMPSVVLKLIPIAEGATATAGVERAPLRMAAAAGGIALAVSAAGASSPPPGAGGAAGPSNPQPSPPGSGSSSSSSSTSSRGPGGASGGSGGSGSSGSSPGGSGGPGGAGGSGSSGAAGAAGASGAAGADGVSVETIGGGGVATVSGSRPAGSGSLGER